MEGLIVLLFIITWIIILAVGFILYNKIHDEIIELKRDVENLKT